jgi:hypothetical protein
MSDYTAADCQDQLVYELTEAQAEIRRHHRDFKSIQNALDIYEANRVWGSKLADMIELAAARAMLRKIRSIVG